MVWLITVKSKLNILHFSQHKTLKFIQPNPFPFRYGFSKEIIKKYKVNIPEDFLT